MTSEKLKVKIVTFILAILVLISTISTTHIALGQDYAGSSDASNGNNTNDSDSGSDNATTTSETQPALTSDADTNSTQSSQEDEQPSKNVTAQDSDSQDTNQTSANSEQDYTTAGDNQTAASSSNATSTNDDENNQDKYQNINGTSMSNFTSTVDQDNNRTSTSDNYSNATYTGNDSTDMPLGNNSINYNDTQTEANVTSENNSNANITDTTNNNSTAGAAENQNATALTTPGPVPDFTISVDPLIMNVNAGSSTTYSIVVTSVNGFSSNVSLAITSPPISGITSSLGSNITRPPVNASTTSLLTIQSDATAHSGKYKLKVTGSAANVTGTRAALVTLEVMGPNVTATANDTLGLDAVALTPILIKNIEGNGIFTDRGLSTEKMVFISTTVVNNYNKTQPFILVIEIRDNAHQTLLIQLLRGVLNQDGQLEFDISWMPNKAGTYEIRSFVIDHLPDPSPLSAVIGRTYVIS